MRQYMGAACGLWLGLTGAVAVQAEPAVVVELFTSQGCSSCPPADEHLARLAADPRVIPLALHVDYWDYIGWTDPFGHAAFTERQKNYARAEGGRTIYTPQMIVGGAERVEGTQPEQVEQLIRSHVAAGYRVSLTVERVGDRVVIRAMAEPPLTEPVQVQVVRYRPEEEVAIETGENAGRVITYHNIVTSWDKVADWPGQSPLEMEAEAPGDDPVVVILQRPGPAEILAAFRVE